MTTLLRGGSILTEKDGLIRGDLLIKDGEWHILVIDLLSYSTIKTFTPDANGDFRAKFIRFDFFNGQPMPADSYMDVAYVGMCVDPAPFLAK